MKKILLTFLLVTTLVAPAQTRAATFVAGDLPQLLKEYVGDTLINAVVNKVVGSITSSITNWANSGFKGKPAFITDLKKTMSDLEGEVVSGLLNEIENDINLKNGTNLDLDGFFCGPFDREIRDALRIKLAVKSAKAPFTERSRCTLDSILEKAGNTLEDFEGDFSKGGWPAWLELTEPENNRWGSISLSYKEIWNKESEAKKTKETDVLTGRGFQSQFKPRECLPNPAQIGPPNPDLMGPPAPTGPKGWPINAQSGVEECPPDYQKTNDKNVTPGAVIENKLNESLGLGNVRLAAADEINEMLGAIVTALVEKAFSSAGGMLGLSDSESGESELDKVSAEGRSKGDALAAKAVETADGAAESGSATMTAIEDVQRLEDALETCLRLQQLNAPDTTPEVNVDVTVPPEEEETSFLFGAKIAHAVDLNDDGLEDDAGNVRNCDLIKAQLEAARAKLKNLTMANIDTNTDIAISGGGSENPFQCRFKFGGQSASRDVTFSRSGPVNGLNDKDSFYGYSFLIPAETNKFYGTVSLSFEAKSGKMPINNIVNFNASQKGNFYNGMQMGITTDLRNTRWDNNAYAGGPNYFGRNRTAWVGGDRYRVEINFDSKTNTLKTKITNLTRNTVAGEFSIAGALASGDLAPPDGNFRLIFGGTDWVYSNINVKLTPGGPYGEGMPGRCGLPGGEPMSG